MIISAGGIFTIFFCTMGVIKLLSVTWIQIYKPATKPAVAGPCIKPTITAGIIAIIGPKLGMKFRMPGINASASHMGKVVFTATTSLQSMQIRSLLPNLLWKVVIIFGNFLLGHSDVVTWLIYFTFFYSSIFLVRVLKRNYSTETNNNRKF